MSANGSKWQGPGLLVALLAIQFAGPAAVAATFPGGTVDVLATVTNASLNPIGLAPHNEPGSGVGGATAESNIMIGTNKVTPDYYRAKSRQTPSGDSLLEYDGYFVFGDGQSTYSGSTSVTYLVTNTADVTRPLGYNFAIEQTELKLLSGGDSFEPPWQVDTGGAGVQLRHTVKLLSGGSIFGDQVISDRSFDFWTFYPGGGAQLTYNDEQSGLPTHIIPIQKFYEHAGWITEGWKATILEELYQVELGVFAPGESKTLQVAMTLDATHGVEREIYAAFADPGEFSGRFGEYTGTAVVPLPAAAWLFLSALGCLGIIKRKRH